MEHPPSCRSRSAVTPLMLLAYMANNTSPHELFERMYKKISMSAVPPADIEAILQFYRIIGFSTFTALTAIQDNLLRHCARCHRSYFERDNGIFTCMMPHSNECPTLEDGPYYICRGGDCRLWHFVGRHTTKSTNVRYNPNNVKTCGQRHCIREVIAASALLKLRRGRE